MLFQVKDGRAEVILLCIFTGITFFIIKKLLCEKAYHIKRGKIWRQQLLRFPLL